MTYIRVLKLHIICIIVSYYMPVGQTLPRPYHCYQLTHK